MRVRKLFNHEEGTPVTRDNNLKSSVQNMTSKLCIFPFMFFLCIFPFYIFNFFGVDKGVALAPTYHRVR